MPTHEEEASFWKDWASLSQQQRKVFIAAIEKMVEDMRGGQGFRKGLRIKGVQGYPGVYEMTWADDGRATFSYGTSPVDGKRTSSGGVLARTTSSRIRNRSRKPTHVFRRRLAGLGSR